MLIYSISDHFFFVGFTGNIVAFKLKIKKLNNNYQG
jgi:hypothetical protein